MAIFHDVQINGEGYKVLVETVHPTREHGEIRACTAVHEQRFARRIGGVRFVPGAPPEDRTELGELAEAMTWKSALAGIPADGEKSVVYCPDGLPQSAEMAQIMAAHLAELKVADPGVIFGPDINCGEAVMDLLAHEHGEGDHVSGLIKGKGGLSIDGYGYTARGLEAALLAAADRLSWDLTKMRATIQGLGAVGAHVARNLRQHGVAIQAVNSYHGALIATTPAGLDIDLLFKNWQEHEDAYFPHYKDATPAGMRWAERDSIFEEPAEIFIPAARTDVLAMPGEPQALNGAKDITRFVEATGVKVILEGANHPLTAEAEKYMEDRGVFILPDYLVNCGGLIGCWADWVYRHELEGKGEGEWYARLNDGARSYTAKVVERNVPRVLDATGNQPRGIRQAAHKLAKELRDEFGAEFEAYLAGKPTDPDGRAFGRLCMDKLLQ
ncbi:MAG TPA: Glu/Leu/Phe/Val dehydrogenase dimerization domain-containing protein [Thermoanaerobaculia bacterium]|jgi:glutamate dehydrogenase/leucine dehydrogenase|nr:Glu/Leu/Phe/Val dehydrogenase dimerization domain-containing protein [Thermoanaerobaculia bacterium]